VTRGRGLFVVGTDTGVGKTTVACGLLRLALRRGLRPVPFKPAETGCDPNPLDAWALWRASGERIPRESVCFYPFRLPAAPALAALSEGVRVDIDRLVTRARELAAAGDWLLVEGAGGLLVPYAPGVTAGDLLASIGLPVLIVARTSLGTINHTSLTVREIQRTGVPIAAVLLSQTEPTIGPQEFGNADLIADVTGLRPLGPLPYLPATVRADPEALADAIEAALEPSALDRLLART
jgi:dethiobiotin synthetase